MIVSPELASAKPYLIRAMHEWCSDQGLTAYVSVFVDEQVKVPLEFVQDGAITLNVGVEATNGLHIGNDVLQFKARFAGVPREVMVPITHIMAIYGRENGQGMAFPIADPAQSVQIPDTHLPMATPKKLAAKPTTKSAKTKPILTRIK